MEDDCRGVRSISRQRTHRGSPGWGRSRSSAQLPGVALHFGRLARRTSIVGSDEGQRHEVGYFRHGSILRLLSNRFPVNKARRRQC
jgi:hypothetical protein